MNQQWTTSRVPVYAAHQQLMRSTSLTLAQNSPIPAHQQLMRSTSLTLAQNSPIPSSISSHFVHPDLNSVMSPQISPMCEPSPQFFAIPHPTPQFSSMCHPSPQLSPMLYPSNQNISSTSCPKVAGSMGQLWPTAHLCHPIPQFSPMCHPTPQVSPMSHPTPQVSPMCLPSPQFPPMYLTSPQYPNYQNMSPTSGLKVAGIMGQVWPSAYQPPNNLFSSIRADNMTIKQTAEWVRALGCYHAWKETDTYANNFKTKNISGNLLKNLTKETLKEELGIVNLGHRLMIMYAIKRLCQQSAVSMNLAEKKPAREHELSRPMSELMTETEGEKKEDIAFSFQGSPSMRSMMGYSPNSQNENNLGANKNNLSKWSESPGKCTTTVNCSSRTLANPILRSNRASPTNPLVFRTLVKVRLRSGKSYRAKDLGFLPKGAVVLINQIKGRSGRVVFREEDGSFKTRGWVCLFTENKRHLLKRYNQKTKDVGSAVPLSADEIVE